MITLDVKSDAKSASQSPLSLSTPSTDEGGLSFSDLLKGVSEKKDSKTIQNGVLLLSLEEDTKSIVGSKETKGNTKLDALMSLLKNEEVVDNDLPIELNPKLTENLSTKDIKVLVSEAKDYLKQKIESSDDYKNAQIKDLPKTLKGLVQVAKKFDIDISKITVQEVQTKKQIPKIKSVLPLKDVAEVKTDDKTQTSPVKTLLQARETKVEVKDQVINDDDIEVKTKSQAKSEVDADVDIDVKAKVKVDEKVELKTQVKQELKTDKTEVKIPQNLEPQKTDEKVSLNNKEIKQTPLFKAQALVEQTTTEQIVQVKASIGNQTIQRTPKDKADETLKLLLRGEKPSINTTGLTADFSVATAKVIAPSATTNLSKSFEQLLHGDASESTTVKVDGISTPTSDDFEVKLNEAKQLVKYLSADVKTAIEDYKSPFTRIKLQLNPAKLGEVDLTIVQRGKNLHVNISSNNVAVNTLAMNVNDLKVQLQNSGINNASLNFSNSSQNGEQAGQQQQNRQNEQQQAHEEYNFFENEEANEEILSSLEIVVPQYG